MFPGSHRLHSCFLWHIFVIFKQPHESHPHRKQSTFNGSLPTRRLYQRESCGSKGNQYNTNSEARDSNTQCESARWWRDSKKSGFSFPCCKPKIERSSFCHRLTLRLWWSSQLHPLCHTLLLYTETAVSSSHTLSNFLQNTVLLLDRIKSGASLCTLYTSMPYQGRQRLHKYLQSSSEH